MITIKIHGILMYIMCMSPLLCILNIVEFNRSSIATFLHPAAVGCYSKESRDNLHTCENIVPYDTFLRLLIIIIIMIMAVHE